MHTFGTLTKSVIAVVGTFLFLGLLFTPQLHSQEAVIEGTVTSALTGNPLPGANIIIRGTTIGTATNIDGRYRLTVPSARVTGAEEALVASFVGYRARTQTLTLTSGTHTVNFELAEDVLGLEDVVVTGVVGATFRERLPFSVDLVTRRDLEEVPYTSAEQAIRGKVAGARVVQSTGQPGTAARVQLRGPTSIDVRGRSNEPLYVVDGVILGSSMVDIDAMDIESIEVVKGAAAASLYGSRAAAGVVQIQTRRGESLAMDQTTITLRNEFGWNSIENMLGRAQHHLYLTDAQGRYIDEEGEVVGRSQRVAGDAFTTFMDKPYIDPLFDHLDTFHDPGNFMINTISVAQRAARTNFLASFSNTQESGVITALQGYDRQSFRLNLDHRLLDDLTLSANAYYSTSWRDMFDSRPDGGGPGSLFFAMFQYGPDVDITEQTDDIRFPGEVPFVIRPDPLSLEENPLYEVHNREFEQSRRRMMGSFRLNFAPFEWMNLEGSLSYDRGTMRQWFYYPKGYRTIDQPLFTSGQLEITNAATEAINAQIDATFTHNFGLLGTRSQFRYLAEFQDYDFQGSTASELAVGGVPRQNLGNPALSQLNSFLSTVRAEGFYFITGLDYDGRYILDFLVRRDGSSLFGPDERWHTYYRMSGAYRMAQETWWPIDPVNEFKVRYSIGTAGGRPSFAAQYETWSIAAGSVFKGNLGNRDLKPEFSTEQEFGVEIGFLDRFLLDVTYAHTTTEDQILLVPLPGYAGFNNQWRNAGTLEAKTIEASLRGQLIQSRDISWSASILFDRTTQEITEFNLPPYRFGPVDFYWVQGSDVFYMREGEVFGTMYGHRFIDNMNDLPAGLPTNQFQVNDDGYVVWVGEGNTYRDGVANNLWGTQTEIDGRTYRWGVPIMYFDEDGNNFVEIGNVVPDFNLSFGTNFRYKNASIYMLFDGQFGGKIYNQTRQWSYRDMSHPDQDQAGKPEDLKKPFGYYETLYNANNSTGHFAEDGTYVKLRELSVRYTFDRGQLRPIFGGWLNRVTLGIVGRNLITWTDYSGFDPEIGMTQDAITFRFDSFSYPNFRTITGVIELEF